MRALLDAVAALVGCAHPKTHAITIYVDERARVLLEEASGAIAVEGIRRCAACGASVDVRISGGETVTIRAPLVGAVVAAFESAGGAELVEEAAHVDALEQLIEAVDDEGREIAVDGAGLVKVIETLTSFQTCPLSDGGEDERAFMAGRLRPYDGQPHTMLGERGSAVLHSVTMRDVGDAIATEIARAREWAAETGGESSFDEGAIAMNVCILLEKMIGTFPNVPTRTWEERKESASESSDTRISAAVAATKALERACAFLELERTDRAIVDATAALAAMLARGPGWSAKHLDTYTERVEEACTYAFLAEVAQRAQNAGAAAQRAIALQKANFPPPSLCELCGHEARLHVACTHPEKPAYCIDCGAAPNRQHGFVPR